MCKVLKLLVCVSMGECVVVCKCGKGVIVGKCGKWFVY